MTRFIKSGVFKSLGRVAVAKVDVARQSNGWPTGLFKDAAKPAFCAAANGALQERCRLGLTGAGTLEGIGAVTNSFGGLSFVVLFPAKSFGLSYENTKQKQEKKMKMSSVFKLKR